MQIISKNPIISFLTRILFVAFISSIIWIFTIYYYYEYNIANDIKQEIEREKIKFQEAIIAYNISKENNEKIDMLKNELHQNDVEFFRLYDSDKNLILDIENLDDKKIVEIENYPLFKDNLYYRLIKKDQDIYLFFQSKVLLEEKYFYLLMFFPLDEKSVQLIDQDIQYTILVVIITVILIVISTLPLVVMQYKKLINSKNELLEANLSILLSLGNAIAKRDSDTNEHNYRVAYYSIKIAEALHLPKKQIQSLIKGAFLHDIGKIAISDNILLKPSKLTIEEFNIMKTHVNHGVDIIENISWLENAKDVILYHHEKVNGEGYPLRVKDNEIPLNAKIFAVADVFDALSSKRPYKKAFSIDESFHIIKKDINKHFDEKIVTTFELIYRQSYADIHAKNSKELKDIFYKIFKMYF